MSVFLSITPRDVLTTLPEFDRGAICYDDAQVMSEVADYFGIEKVDGRLTTEQAQMVDCIARLLDWVVTQRRAMATAGDVTPMTLADAARVADGLNAVEKDVMWAKIRAGLNKPLSESGR